MIGAPSGPGHPAGAFSPPDAESSKFSEFARRWRLVPGFPVLALVVVGCVLLDARLIVAVLENQPLGLDFLPLWTALRVDDAARVYDFAHITELQTWLFERKVRPFINPPSTLSMLWVFGSMPFFVAYASFVTLSSALFAWASARVGADWRLVLIPHVCVLVILVGQVTFLVGGLVMLGLTMPKRPLLQGVLFALAGALKPQMLLLLPIALIAGGRWRTMIATAVVSGALVAISWMLGGDWLAWLGALARFRDLVESDPTLVRMSATPYAHIGPFSLLLTIPLALAAVWLSFREKSVPLQLLALFGGAILISPYALGYEVALLVPAILALEPKPRASTFFWIALVLFASPFLAILAAILVFFTHIKRQSNGSIGKSVQERPLQAF